MAKKVSDVIALLHPKAVKASLSQVVAFLNYDVMEDIRVGITSTWPDQFEAYQEIPIDGSVETDYALASDYWRPLEVLDQSGVAVEVARTHSQSDNRKSAVLFTFDVNGAPIVRVNATTGITKLIIKYERTFTEMTSSENDLPFPDHISRQILPILAKGVSYFYLRSRKKTTEVQFIFTEYEDLKASVFEGTVINL